MRYAPSNGSDRGLFQCIVPVLSWRETMMNFSHPRFEVVTLLHDAQLRTAVTRPSSDAAETKRQSRVGVSGSLACASDCDGNWWTLTFKRYCGATWWWGTPATPLKSEIVWFVCKQCKQNVRLSVMAVAGSCGDADEPSSGEQLWSCWSDRNYRQQLTYSGPCLYAD